jgi:competence protein ComEA
VTPKLGGAEVAGGIQAVSDRVQQFVIVVLAAVVAAGIVAFVIDRQSGPDTLEIDLPNTVEAGPIEVYITGAVAEPGVYQMDNGDRVIDVLFEAGGHTDDANLEAINLAVRLHDEDQIVVPRFGQDVSTVAGATSPKININTATAGELDALPGIGEVYSQQIVVNREANGPYVSSEELVERQVIPRSTYERIRDLITACP